MRRLSAIAVALCLLMAPLAMVANSVSMVRYEKQLSMTAHDDHCGHRAPLGICGCYPGHAPVPIVISPLPELLLPLGVSAPAASIQMQDRPSPRLIFPAGFTPVAFHPPRG